MPPKSIPIDKAAVDQYRLLNFNWTRIAKLIGCSTDTLSRWRQANNYEDPLRIPDDEELDLFVSNVSKSNDKICEIIMSGRLVANGMNVSRERLRASINRVDPDGREQRKKTKLKRREYNVSGPHALWHIDGNHKLIRWGIVTHGCIDGYSRYIVFIKASDNNRSNTVLNSFDEAINFLDFFPSRIRGDYGGENILVAKKMIENNGLDRGSFICGSSTRNQRIERLWRDFNEQVTIVFSDLFKLFEDEKVLNIENNDEIFCLHYLFLPVLNKHIKEFKDGWNNHKIRTENHKTPNQILVEEQSKTAAYPDNINQNDYGVEGDFSDNEDDEREQEEANQVILESTKNPFNEEQYELFVQNTAEYIINNDDNNNTIINKLFNVIWHMKQILRYI